MIDEAAILIDETAAEPRGSATSVVGWPTTVDEFVGGRMFTSIYYANGERCVRFLLFLAVFLLFVMGAATATIFLRRRANGVIAWTLLPTLLAAVAGYFVLRRATPRN
ncbi:MAG: hypothetical protein JWM50_1394 [Microbacteriaceae bacterium]|nr:hypothetical protein [Microbacteriaceae bacterium]